MTTTRLRLTCLLATAATLVAAVLPAPAAAERPANFGTCIARAAMTGGGPIREWTQYYSPIVAFDDVVISPPGGEGIGLACGIEGLTRHR